MPINRDDVLRPLGGEDNLRLMCDAKDFQYIHWVRGLQVTFSIPNYSVDVVYFPNRLDHINRWSLSVWGPHRIRRVHNSSSILNPELLASEFEWATKYSLSF